MTVFTKKIIAASALLAGDTPQEIWFKAHMLLILFPLSRKNRLFTMDELVILGEDFPYALPTSRIKSLLKELPILKQEGNGFRIQSEIDLAEWYQNNGFYLPKGTDLAITWDEVNDILKEKVSQPSLSAFNIQTAVKKGLGWCLHAVRVSEAHEIGGLPAFWDCIGNTMSPMGTEQAGTCNSDALAAVCGSMFGPVKTDLSESSDNKEFLSILLQYNLNCLVAENKNNQHKVIIDNWNVGGFLPMEDQPGAEHPTVEATANFIIAAAKAYFFFDEFANQGVLFSVTKASLGETILEALEFLLNQELKGGAWGIYRYKGDKYNTVPNPFPTALVVISFSKLKMCGVLDDLSHEELYRRVNSCLKRTLNFLMVNKTEYKGFTAWSTDFSSDLGRIPETEIFGITLFCTKALFAMSLGMPEIRKQVYPVLRDFVKFMETHWKPDYAALYKYEFRVPLEWELNSTFNTWEIQYDVRLSEFLLDLYNETRNTPDLRVFLSLHLWDNIEITIGHLLREQHQGLGHWGDPINMRPFAVSTLFATETLQAYLLAVKNMLEDSQRIPTRSVAYD